MKKLAVNREDNRLVSLGMYVSKELLTESYADPLDFIVDKVFKDFKEAIREDLEEQKASLQAGHWQFHLRYPIFKLGQNEKD